MIRVRPRARRLSLGRCGRRNFGHVLSIPGHILSPLVGNRVVLGQGPAACSIELEPTHREVASSPPRVPCRAASGGFRFLPAKRCTSSQPKNCTRSARRPARFSRSGPTGGSAAKTCGPLARTSSVSFGLSVSGRVTSGHAASIRNRRKKATTNRPPRDESVDVVESTHPVCISHAECRPGGGFWW